MFNQAVAYEATPVEAVPINIPLNSTHAYRHQKEELQLLVFAANMQNASDVKKKRKFCNLHPVQGVPNHSPVDQLGRFNSIEGESFRNICFPCGLRKKGKVNGGFKNYQCQRTSF